MWGLFILDWVSSQFVVIDNEGTGAAQLLKKVINLPVNYWKEFYLPGILCGRAGITINCKSKHKQPLHDKKFFQAIQWRKSTRKLFSSLFSNWYAIYVPKGSSLFWLKTLYLLLLKLYCFLSWVKVHRGICW